jgi:hypothetical protein
MSRVQEWRRSGQFLHHWIPHLFIAIVGFKHFVLFPDTDFWSMISQCHGPFIVSEKGLLLWLGPDNITSKKRLFPCPSSFHRYFHDG